MDFIRAAFARSEALIDGRVRVELFKGNVTVTGRESPSSLYDRELSSMDVEGGYDQADARGFIRINALRLQAHQLILGSAAATDEHGEAAADSTASRAGQAEADG
jgi:argininosuccinate synthase